MAAEAKTEGFEKSNKGPFFATLLGDATATGDQGPGYMPNNANATMDSTALAQPFFERTQFSSYQFIVKCLLARFVLPTPEGWNTYTVHE